MDQTIDIIVNKKKSRVAIGDIVKGRNLRVGDVVSVVDTDFALKIIFKTFFEILAVPVKLTSGKTPKHIHRIQILPFTRVTLLERD